MCRHRRGCAEGVRAVHRKNPKIGDGMYLSGKRPAVGRQFFTADAGRETEEVQYLCGDPGGSGSETAGADRAGESGHRSREGETGGSRKGGVKHDPLGETGEEGDETSPPFNGVNGSVTLLKLIRSKQ